MVIHRGSLAGVWWYDLRLVRLFLAFPNVTCHRLLVIIYTGQLSYYWREVLPLNRNGLTIYSRGWLGVCVYQVWSKNDRRCHVCARQTSNFGLPCAPNPAIVDIERHATPPASHPVRPHLVSHTTIHGSKQTMLPCVLGLGTALRATWASVTQFCARCSRTGGILLVPA